MVCTILILDHIYLLFIWFSNLCNMIYNQHAIGHESWLSNLYKIYVPDDIQ